MMGAEFLAMILIIVYVGAVAVLFLFVVMMLNINFAELRAGFLQYLPIGGVIGIILLAELVLVFASGAIDLEMPTTVASPMPRLTRSPTPRRWATCSTRTTPTCSRARDSSS